MSATAQRQRRKAITQHKAQSLKDAKCPDGRAHWWLIPTPTPEQEGNLASVCKHCKAERIYPATIDEDVHGWREPDPTKYLVVA